MAGDEVFATLVHPRRVWAVAAIHGERDRLAALHDALSERLTTGDRLVYLGNYFGHGPDIVGTVDELLSFRRDFLCLGGVEPGDIVYLRGAQEEMWRKLMEIHFAPGPSEVLEWMLKQGVGATLAAYGGSADQARGYCREGALAIARWTGSLRAAVRAHPGHDELMASLRRAAFTEGGELLFVHAGIDPVRPLSEQNDTFWWGTGEFGELVDGYAGFRLVVRGFDRHDGPARIGRTVASVDGGAGFGGTLNACCFDLNGQAVDWIEIQA